MPLINSIVKAFIRQQNKEFCVVEEIGSKDLYEYIPQEKDVYIEGEILHIRTEGYHKNFELGRHDRVEGPVVESEFDANQIILGRLDVRDRGEWNPLELYGEKACDALFPGLKDSTKKLLEVVHPQLEKEEDIKLMGQIREAMAVNDFEAAKKHLSELIASDMLLVECYRLLGYLHLQRQQVQVAKKYFEWGQQVTELSLPDDLQDIVCFGKYPGNFTYLSFLHGQAFVFEHEDAKEDAVNQFRYVYGLDPTDHLGARFAINRLTGETMPLLDPNFRGGIDPYLFVAEYDVPIKDVYDPNVKVDPVKWLDWDTSYKMLLIANAHQNDPMMAYAKAPEIQQHIQLHLVTESAIATNEPPMIRLQLARLIASGNSRHDALHNMGQQMLDAFRQAEQNAP